MLTPRYETRTIANGTATTIRAYGRHILIASISASTLTLSLDDDQPQRILAGLHIDCADRKYTRITLSNTGAVASTVVLVISEVLVDLQSNGGILAGMAASLVSIDQEISGSAAAAVAGQKADIVCPLAPAAGTLIFAANANRTEIEISAPPKNGAGVVYLGVTAARCTVADNFKVLRAGESWWSEREKGAIYAASSTGAEVVNGREC
jgi:hypothetical protein